MSAAMTDARAGIPGRRQRDATDSSPRTELATMAVIAFATEARSERSLREGLSGFEDAQVWPGGVHAAAAALGRGHPVRLVFVDIDGIPYPAGAVYELSAVCEVGTIVVAFGSDGTARFSRDILIAGVSDYLVKPITASAVRESAARAAADWSLEGALVGFAGTGGSGATTLAAATALLAAERGRYVSVLDLNRTFSAFSFTLDVEPAGGLVDLLSTVARASLHPEMVDGVRAQRSDRLSVYGYPWSVEPPPLAPVWAVCELLVELQRRSHLVIVDGMDDPATRQTLLAIVDTRVLVVEPTVTGAAAAGRMMTQLGPMHGDDWPTVFVQNHTRAFRTHAGVHAFARVGVATSPHVVVPFAPSLPRMTDRGWPQRHVPRILRDPLGRLADRILAEGGRDASAAASVGAEESQPASRTSPRSDRRRRKSRTSGARPRPSRVRAALRRLLPLRTARPRPA